MHIPDWTTKESLVKESPIKESPIRELPIKEWLTTQEQTLKNGYRVTTQRVADQPK